MSIIGIISSQRQVNQIKKEIEKENLKTQIICINYKSIENIKNIKFEIVIIHDSIEKLKEKQEYLKIILKNANYLLLNTDVSINEKKLEDINVKILTYGLKQKSTITASGIGEKQAIISLQRGFKNLNGKVIEQQEIPIELMGNSIKDLYNALIKIAIINIFDAKNR